MFLGPNPGLSPQPSSSLPGGGLGGRQPPIKRESISGSSPPGLWEVWVTSEPKRALVIQAPVQKCLSIFA